LLLIGVAVFRKQLHRTREPVLIIAVLVSLLLRKEGLARRVQVSVGNPGMIGKGTEVQNLGKRGNPAPRLKNEVACGFN
jgi:hypothetical protein